jgi:hypothetical protein
MALFSFPVSRGMEGCQTFLLLAVFCFIGLVLVVCSYFLLRNLIYRYLKGDQLRRRNNIRTAEVEPAQLEISTVSVEVGIINDDIINIDDVKIIKK